MTVFEPRSFCAISNCSANCATTTCNLSCQFIESISDRAKQEKL